MVFACAVVLPHVSIFSFFASALRLYNVKLIRVDFYLTFIHIYSSVKYFFVRTSFSG